MRRVIGKSIGKSFVLVRTVFIAVVIVGVFTVAEWRLPDRAFKLFISICLREK